MTNKNEQNNNYRPKYLVKQMALLAEQNWRKGFSQKLKTRMDELELSQHELSRISGVSQSEICNYVHALHTPTVTALIKLATALNVGPEYLMCN